nr:unnamed protein product [Callosobruchus chinensis]
MSELANRNHLLLALLRIVPLLLLLQHQGRYTVEAHRMEFRVYLERQMGLQVILEHLKRQTALLVYL